MIPLITGLYKIELENVDSTNNYAQQLLKEKQLEEGTLIFAKVQTAGRGQRYKQWESEGFMNLTISIIYHPDFLTASSQFVLNKAVSLAVSDFIKDMLLISSDTNLNNNTSQKLSLIKIKWPNDIYFENKKIGGILIENNIRSGRIETTVIGIGININQVIFNKFIPNPVSLKMISGIDYNLYECCDCLCKKLDYRYFQLKSRNYSKLDSDYLDILYRYNESSEFIIAGAKVKASITGITAEGKLILDGNESYNLHEVAFVV